ncbi:heparinase II/III family protein [Paenibacillus eucommiae]|uniref:Heparinase II/III-like protein n=1 Tax=Paenibacillus eucommiae TaxID=1355755 RepID=A0ABS4IRR5_9BACL|nr:heparinase II/III family protein [Paenibacillus eucommiae]MBP1990230.1 hypothetical protein [Paenibacillus eucommiae]
MSETHAWHPPESIKVDWTLEHPRVFYSKDCIAQTRLDIDSNRQDWKKLSAKRLIDEADALQWMAMDDEDLRSLVPKPHSYYMYGVTDPVGPDGTRIHPIGWEAPGLVRSEGGQIYPNAQYPDDGTGWEDGHGNCYYFVARWNGFVVDALSQALEPLAYAYALSGDARYAHKAAVILDSLATIYPLAIEGPLDYPGSKRGVEGGRLERPFYQVARTLIWYVNAIDLIWECNVLDERSPTNPSMTLKHNIIYNLLLNGADYCEREAQLPGYVDQLHNGTADYNLGLLAVGSLLGIERYAARTVEGLTSLEHMIANNIDRDGNYFETSALYSRWTRGLYVNLAELLFLMRTPKWPEGVNLYDHPRFARFYIEISDKNCIAGRIPSYGDSLTDEKQDVSVSLDPVELEWIQHFIVRTRDGSKRKEWTQLLYDKMVEVAASPQLDHTAWTLFNWREPFLEQSAHSPSRHIHSELLGGKGLAILRSDNNKRGAVMRFGATLNHGQLDELGIHIYDDGRELSFDPGYNMAHYRGGWQFQTVSHLTVAVNESSQLSVDSAGGSLHFYAASPILSVVDASDASAYSKEGVKEYRRLIAWIEGADCDPYMVDLFRVNGGQTRDYSFHARGKSFDTEGLQLSEPAPGSVLSQLHEWGNHILGDGRVSDFTNQSFEFVAPGAGYGFLSTPCSAEPEGVWSARWSSPGSLKLTMLPAERRKVIVAEGPSVMGVKYVLARDTGSTSSPFVAVIETGENRQFAQVIPLKRDDMESVDSESAAFAVMSKHSLNGISSDYLLSTLTGEVITAFGLQEGSQISSDAEFAFMRLDPIGRMQVAHMVKGKLLKYKRFELRTTYAELTGRVVAVDEKRAQLKVEGGPWISEAVINECYGLIDHEDYSHHSSYRIEKASLEGEYMMIDLDPGDITLACGKIIAEPFENILPNGVNLPYSRNVLRQGPNQYFTGKRVMNQEGVSAVITAVRDNYAALEVDRISGFECGDALTIFDVKAGDQFRIPVSVHLYENAYGEYELSSPIAVIVSPEGDEIVEVRGQKGWRMADRELIDGTYQYRVEPHESGKSIIRMINETMAEGRE